MWSRTKDDAELWIDSLLLSGKEYRGEGLPREDEERTKFMGTNLVSIVVPTTTTTTTTTGTMGRGVSSVVGISTEDVATKFHEFDFGIDYGDHCNDSHLIAKSSGPASDANPSEARNVVLDKGKSLATTIELDENTEAQSEGGFSPCFLDLAGSDEEDNFRGKERTSGGESSAQAAKRNVDPTLGFKSRSDLSSSSKSRRRRSEVLVTRKELVNFTKTMDVSRF